MDPSAFNVVSYVFVNFTSILIGLAVPLLYPMYTTWKVQSGLSIPVDEFTQIPGDFWSAVDALRRFLLATEFSHDAVDP